MATISDTLSARAAGELNTILTQFTSGEAEVVRAYFAEPRSTAENLDVLLRQMGREIQAASRLPMAADMFARLEDSVERHAFAEYLEHVAQETQHYVILADLAEWVAGR